MTSAPASRSAITREVWLRRGTALSSKAPGKWRRMSLSDIGLAAARETFSTATLPFAGAWTDLFQGMTIASQKLRWHENGPGLGRDARIAYSSLLGRYMARAYLTAHEDVRVLIPLDEAKRWLQRTPYSIRKRTPGPGLEADWIGLDGHRRLVIAEAKGSFDRGVRTWRGPDHIPRVLCTALGQAHRTVVFETSLNRQLPAKRWAVVSRWANTENRRRPALLAWDPDDGELHDDDYQALETLLHRADVTGILRGLGHLEAPENRNVDVRSLPRRGDLSLRIAGQDIERGFAAAFGPIGRLPLRNREDLDRVRLIREVTANVALASLSSQYAGAVMLESRTPEEDERDDPAQIGLHDDVWMAQRAGLTVVWPTPGQHIELADG